MSNPIETSEFWKHHLEQFKASGLTRSQYCCEQGINYDRFGYWIRKLSPTNLSEFVPIKIQTTTPSVSDVTLCTLELRSHIIKIHDLSALSFILDRMN